MLYTYYEIKKQCICSKCNRGDQLLNNLDQQILQLKIEGRSMAEIALMLGLTERTVKDRLSRIYEKLGGYENTIRFYSSQ